MRTVPACVSGGDADCAVTVVLCTRSKNTVIAVRELLCSFPGEVRLSLHFVKRPSCIAFPLARRKINRSALVQRTSCFQGQPRAERTACISSRAACVIIANFPSRRAAAFIRYSALAIVSGNLVPAMASSGILHKCEDMRRVPLFFSKAHVRKNFSIGPEPSCEVPSKALR